MPLLYCGMAARSLVAIAASVRYPSSTGRLGDGVSYFTHGPNAAFGSGEHRRQQCGDWSHVVLEVYVYLRTLMILGTKQTRVGRMRAMTRAAAYIQLWLLAMASLSMQ